VARTLPEVHVDGLAGANRSGWYSAATRLEAQVPHLTDGQVTVGLLRLVARLHDDETVLAAPFARFFPFGARWVGRHLCLLTVTGSDRSLLGAELMSVDGHPMSDVLAALSTVVDYQDPGVLRYAEWQLIDNADLLHWLGLTRSEKRATFTVRTIAGSLKTVTLATITDKGARQVPLVAVPHPFFERHAAMPYWMRILRSRRAVYLKYNICVPTDGFQRLASRAIDVLRQHHGYRLIVDLRDNGGGTTAPFQKLISGILADPAINTRGRIFGLINYATDSSAGLDAAQLGQQTNAILLGEQIEDPIDRFGNSSGVLRLPHARFAISYTTAVVNPSGQPQGAPDIVIRPTLRQVLEGIDPVLDRALRYGLPAAPRSG
jgi:hypothetical protein